MLAASAGEASLIELISQTEALTRGREDSLEVVVESAFELLRDILYLHTGSGETLTHEDIRTRLAGIASKVDFAWIEQAVFELDELRRLQRRNIQKPPRPSRAPSSAAVSSAISRSRPMKGYVPVAGSICSFSRPTLGSAGDSKRNEALEGVSYQRILGKGVGH